MTDTKNAVLAAKIARAIFKCGDLPQFGCNTQRILFMGGKYPDNERAMGGLNEIALASVIDRALADNEEVNND